ncbi:MAG TPA: hypothetical protein DCQ50_09055 [Chryseobacterium sp.]|nr:hypothetical protein [Chryseobacterium sp.]
MRNGKFLFKLSFVLMACFAIAFSACQKDNIPNTEKPYRMETNLMMDKGLFAASLNDRTSSNVFEIQEVVRKNNLLEVKVKGGGNANSFQFIWDGVILFSYPASIQLLLKYDNSKQDFDADKEMTIEVNLQKILGDKHDAKDFHFNIINGSKLQTVISNPNGSTTKENK